MASIIRKTSIALAMAAAFGLAAPHGEPAFAAFAAADGDGVPNIRPLMVLRPQADVAGEYELLIYGDIGDSWWSESVTALSIVQQLAALPSDVTQINVRINSYGGSVSDGIAIYNVLKRHAARKVVTVDGVAMSSASLIAMAGDEVQMPSTSLMMIHAPWGVAQGNAQDMRIMADVLDTYAEAMSGAYATKTGKSRADMQALLDDGLDHYYTGDQALAEGFADVLIDPLADTQQTDTASQARAAGVQRLLGNAPQHIAQMAIAAAARHPTKLPAASKPRLSVPAGIDMSTLQNALASASGQRALITALTTAASANDGELEMKFRKLFAALQAPATDPADGGNGGGGASQNHVQAASPADVHAALRARNDDITQMLEPYMGRKGINDLYVQALRDPTATVEGIRAQAMTLIGQASTPTAGSHVEMGASEGEKMRDAGAQYLLARSGIIVGADAAKARQGNPFNGMTMMDMAREFAARGGQPVRGLDRQAIIKAALSTADFPNLLENALHKAIIGAFTAQPTTWSRFCKSGSLSDFRPHIRYYMGGFSDLKTVMQNGEYEQGVLSDADRETITGVSKGRILTITHQMIINDDLGVFTDAATLLGKAAARTLEKDVYALLAQNSGLGPNMADGNPLFDASHGNIAGTAAAPGTAAFDAIRVLLSKQTDASGELLDIRPAIWLGPTALGGAARTVNEAQYDTDTSTKQQTPNRSRGLFNDIVDSPRTPDSQRWYAFADAAAEPVIEVGFVDGQAAPQIMAEDDFNSYGRKWRVTYDYGVGAVSWRGAATNAGA